MFTIMKLPSLQQSKLCTLNNPYFGRVDRFRATDKNVYVYETASL